MTIGPYDLPPLIAILRGITAPEIDGIADALFEAGFRSAEVPLNSPDPLASIARLADRMAGRMLVGAGTVLPPEAVTSAHDAGARLIVSPNCDAAVIARTRDLGAVSLPGVMTPTEAFQALSAGASGLKLYPADVLGVSGFKALSAVLPPLTPVYAVGGIDVSRLAGWRLAGVAGVGIGSTLYRPGDTPSVVSGRAQALVAAWTAAVE
jgi:2-dehydro-3-deoxyphosphogalactonate aldolase